MKQNIACGGGSYPVKQVPRSLNMVLACSF